MITTKTFDKLTPVILFGTIAIALFLVSIARVTGYKDVVDASAEAQVVASCDLVFEDRPAGAIHVYNLEDGRLLERFERGNGSFVRGVMRSMTRERRSDQLGAEAAPFRLTRHSNGALTIRDQATGREIFLNAFGVTNADAFARLLSASQSTT